MKFCIGSKFGFRLGIVESSTAQLFAVQRGLHSLGCRLYLYLTFKVVRIPKGSQ